MKWSGIIVTTDLKGLGDSPQKNWIPRLAFWGEFLYIAIASQLCDCDKI